MIEHLKPYVDYKESGLPWLGKIPDHWIIKRGKAYLTCIDERSKTGTEELLTVSSARGVVPRNTASVTMFKAKSYVGYKLCWPGDLVINSLWAWGGGLGVSQYHGIISTAYSVYRSRKSADIMPRYLHELVRSAAFNWELHIRSKGIWISRLQLTDTAFLDAPLPLPPPDEQAAIVKFLDYANGKIERAIRAKRKLIGLLNEQKQAIIHRAVTRGLDPNVKLKPSGIPWLGDVPEHWEIKRIKYLMNTVDCRSATGDEVLLSMRKYHGLVPYHEHFHKPPQAATLKGFKLVKPGQIVVNRMQAGFGLISSSTYDGLVSPDFGVFQPTGEVVPEFLAELFRSRDIRAQFQRESKGLGTGQSGFMRLYDDRIGIVHIAFPPFVDEQHMILSHLRDDVRGVENTIRLTEQEIALLLEYRTTQTAEVVTGKLDVREAAKRLPDGADENISPDDSIEDLIDEEITEEDEA